MWFQLQHSGVMQACCAICCSVQLIRAYAPGSLAQLEVLAVYVVEMVCFWFVALLLIVLACKVAQRLAAAVKSRLLLQYGCADCADML